MRAIRCARLGGPEVLELVELPVPEPGPGEVLVAVEVAGVNFSDLDRRRGHPTAPTPLPFVPGSEVVGRVGALGPGVHTLSVGDRVVGITVERSGGYAEQCRLGAGHVTRIPNGLDAALAVAVPDHGATALHALETMARLTLGDTVAVTAAASGVGGLALQLARRLGASKIIGLVGSEHELAHARALGADVAIDATRSDLAERLREATDGRGVDVVVDNVGAPLTELLCEVLAPFGRLVSIGVASGRPLYIPPHVMTKQAVTVSRFHLDAVLDTPGWLQVTLDRLYANVAAGALVPHVGLVLPLARAAEAHAAMERRATVGKTVLAVAGGARHTADALHEEPGSS